MYIVTHISQISVFISLPTVRIQSLIKIPPENLSASRDAGKHMLCYSTGFIADKEHMSSLLNSCKYPERLFSFELEIRFPLLLNSRRKS